MPGPQLALQAVGAKQRYPRDLVSYGPTLPHNPDIEIQQAGGIGQARDHLALYWDAVLIDFVIEALAEGDDVLVSVSSWRGTRSGAVEPKLQTIKEMKSRPGRKPEMKFGLLPCRRKL